MTMIKTGRGECAGLLLLLLLMVAVRASHRVSVPFQYAWRYHYGDDPTSPPGSGPGTAEWPHDLSNYSLCSGVEHAPNRFSLKDCRLACAYDPNCLVWQAFPIEFGRSCYHGYKGTNVTCRKGDTPSHMGGGRRDDSPDPAFRTDYPFATADASDEVDVTWPIVDAPHDFIAEYANFSNDPENFKQGYLPRNASWYRKHFKLPAEWQGTNAGATYVHFEGVFHHATVFLNGRYLMSHECGYTGFTVRLDNATGVRFGEGENVLAVRADASYGSGHWYEGGGIYRPVHLVHVAPTHIVHDGLFVPPETSGAAIPASVELETTAPDGATAVVTFRLLHEDNNTVLATAATDAIAVPAGATKIAGATLIPSRALKLWTTRSPHTYLVRAEVAVSGIVVDAVTTRVGFRTTSFAEADGTSSPFSLNGEAFRFRGFSHHHSIGGLGVAIPPRVELCRVQASRALGSNVWRMSHNPYAPAVYELLDVLGVMTWDENRDYGAHYGSGAYVVAMRNMVKRDRNHPSVIMWSFCNEAECVQFDAEYSGLAFRAAARGVDPTRPVTANGGIDQVPMAQLDVLGGSHWPNATFVKAHAANRTIPLVLSECCSCMSQRDTRSLPTCIADQNSPGFVPNVSGSLGVWTLMDYFGEPAGTGTSGWPSVSSSFGQFDIALFPKPHAFWYAANWASSGETKDEPGRPALPDKVVARILALPGAASNASTTVEAITTAPFAELYLDGRSYGVLPCARNDRREYETMSWPNTTGISARNATLVAYSGDPGIILATHTLFAPLPEPATGYKLKLILDVPSATTGTGAALLLDGADTALVRCAVVDGATNDALVAGATDRITFRVLSGPGRVAGTANGDATSHEWLKSDSTAAYLGLARGMVRVTQDCTSAGRARCAAIDTDAPRGRTAVFASASGCDADPIVVEASAPGMDPVTISIPVSTDVAKDGVVAVAKATAAFFADGFSYLHDFVG